MGEERLRNGLMSVLQKIPQKGDSLTNAKAPKNQTMLPYRATKRGAGRRPVLSYWLITKNQNGGMRFLPPSSPAAEKRCRYSVTSRKPSFSSAP